MSSSDEDEEEEEPAIDINDRRASDQLNDLDGLGARDSVEAEDMQQKPGENELSARQNTLLLV